MSNYTKDIGALDTKGRVLQARNLIRIIADPDHPDAERWEAERHIRDNAYTYIRALLRQLDLRDQED